MSVLVLAIVAGLVVGFAMGVVVLAAVVAGAREDELVRKLRERGHDG